MNYPNYSWLPAKFDAPSESGAPLSGLLAAATKRLYDLFFSFCGLVLLGPVLLVVALAIKIVDRGPIFYRQQRVGLHGRPFWIWKFRTMVPRADASGPAVTRDGDARITRIGRILRKTKMDELPQLWNVLKGEMSLVGPRPEVPKYVKHYTREQRRILKLKPGITDLASVHFREEEMLLSNADQVEDFYIRHCIPRKASLNMEYAERASLASDTWIILQTICPYWLGVLSLYTLVLTAAFWCSGLLVYDFSVPDWFKADFPRAMVSIVTVQLGFLIWRRQCKGLLSYFSLIELRQIANALGLACLLLLGLSAVTGPGWPPRNVIVVDFILSLLSLAGFRVLLRVWRENSSVEDARSDASLARVGIIGAGSTGTRFARELMTQRKFGRKVVAFFDDDSQKWNRCIHEIPVIGMPECLLNGWEGKLDEVIIALPDAPSSRIRQISKLLQKTGLRAYTAPSAHRLWPKQGNQSLTGENS